LAPEPENDEPVIIPLAFIVPVILILPVPVIFLLFKSKLPPSCGVVSLTTSDNPVRLMLLETDSLTISIISPVDAPVVRTTDEPFDAVNSVLSSLAPFKYTSTNPTVYERPVTVVCPFVATVLLTLLEAVGMYTFPVLPLTLAVIPVPTKLNVVTPDPTYTPPVLKPLVPPPPPLAASIQLSSVPVELKT